MGFTINIAKGLKRRNVNKPTRVSRLCIGIVIREDNDYKIRVSLRNDPDYPDYIIVPFTLESLSLKGKTHVYGRNKDELGHNILYIRDQKWCDLYPGLLSQYSVVVENLVCSGYVVRKNGKLMFEIKDRHGYKKYTHDLPKIDSTKPLFPKVNEHSTSKSS